MRRYILVLTLLALLPSVLLQAYRWGVDRMERRGMAAHAERYAAEFASELAAGGDVGTRWRGALQDAVADHRAIVNARALILDGEGGTLQRIGALFTDSPPPPQLLARARTGGGGSVVLDDEHGTTRVIGYADAPGADGTPRLVAVEFMASSYAEPADMLSALGALALGIALAGFYGRRSLERPLKAILVAAGGRRGGDRAAAAESASLSETLELLSGAVEEQNRRFASLLMNVPGIVFERRMEPDGRVHYSYVSEWAYRHFGLPRGIIHERMLEAVRPDDRAGILAAFRHSADTLTPVDHVIRYDAPDRPERRVRVQAVPRREPDGAVVWAGVMTDVTEHAKGEAILERAQRVARIGSWELDIATRDLAWSDETYRIFGLDKERFQPSFERLVDLFHPDDAAWIGDELEKVRRGGEPPQRMECRARRADGTEIWVGINPEVVRDGTGTVVALIGTLQDITEARAAREALRRSEEQARGVIEASPDAFVRMDENTIVTEWNRSAERLFGWSRDEALGREAAALIRRADEQDRCKEVLRAHVASFSDREGSSRVRFTALRRDGVEIPAESTITSVIQDGKLHFNIFIRDLRDAMETEEKLRQSQKMEAVGQLTGGIAHDFNNLLAIAIGNLDLLDEETALGPEAKELVDAARDACLRGADLTSRLLAFARRQTLQPRPLDLNRLISEYTRLLGRLLGADIDLRLDLGSDVWQATADPNLLEAAITNLATNARDAMPAGGRLTISTRNETVEEEAADRLADMAPGDYVAVEVTDTGQGMPPEVLERAFEPFFTTKGEGKGTGLGLSMVFGFAKQSGGHVRIYSEVGRGTTVTLLLPRALADQEASSQSRSRSPRARRGETILLVEDNASLRRVAASQLASLGYAVLQAEDGPSALRVLERDDRVDLLLTDIIMPGGMSGVDLGREARRLRPGLRLMYMSGFPESALGDRAHLDPDIILMRKPFRQADLAARVREALDAPGKA